LAPKLKIMTHHFQFLAPLLFCSNQRTSESRLSSQTPIFPILSDPILPLSLFGSKRQA
jgi:hypothetical protein